MKNVSHKNAPGAISAIAFDVKPVRPSDGLVVGFSWFDDMSCSLVLFGVKSTLGTAMSAVGPQMQPKIKKALDLNFRSKTS